MKFIRVDNLKIGMRLARPIYSKKGVLLFERNSLLTPQAIESVHNFGLLGIYILEPAEPLPPMFEEDLEFERFQTATVFTLQDETAKILDRKGQNKLSGLAGVLIKRYGHLSKKVNFYQNLRSREDYVYGHSLNVAILCAMMTHVLNVKLEEQTQTVCAALCHDIGRVRVMNDDSFEMQMSEEAMNWLYHGQTISSDLIEEAFPNGAGIRRICMQALKVQMDMFHGDYKQDAKLSVGARILLVANRYDELTAMDLDGHTESEVKALQEFMDYPDIYDPKVVDALTSSINILFPGVSIELSNGEKALVLAENTRDILRPVVLSFKDNRIIDLSLRANRNIQVKDIMKTLDNRYIMDMETLREAGYYYNN